MLLQYTVCGAENFYPGLFIPVLFTYTVIDSVRKYEYLSEKKNQKQKLSGLNDS